MVGMIPESFISSVVSRTDIVELIGSKVELRKAGANFVAKCPFHTEKTPSFSVCNSKQFYHCFGCGAHGDVIKFLMEYEKLSFVEAVEDLAQKLGLDVPVDKQSTTPQNKNATNNVYKALAAAKKYFEHQLKSHPAAKNAVSYLKSRGLTGQIAKEFGVGYAPPGWDNFKKYILQHSDFSTTTIEETGLLIKGAKNTYDRFRNRIIFPIHDRRGKVVGFGGRVIDNEMPKYLNSPETVVFHKGKELYGLYEAGIKTRKLNFLVVVEGYLDVIALAQAGIPQAVATLGTALTPEHLKLLFRMTPEVIFCFDSDEAGHKAANRALEIVLPNTDGNNKVNFLFLPSGEDPDSFIRANGKEAFLQELKRAMPLADFLFSELSKNMNLDAIEDRSLIAIKAKSWIDKVPEGVFKHLLYERLAQLVGLDHQTLINYQERSHNASKDRNKGANKFYKLKVNLPQLPKSPAIIALSLLLLERSLLEEWEQNFSNYEKVDLFGIKLLCAVTRILKEDPNLSTENIKELLPVALAKHFVPDELRNLVSFVPTDGVEAEFLGAIAKIKARYREQRLEMLLSRAKNEELSDENKVELQQLLLDKSPV